MDKKETNFNIWGEISVSELVLEAAKVEQKYEKQQEKRRFAQMEEDDLQEIAKNKCYCNKQCCEGCISFSSLSKHTFTANFETTGHPLSLSMVIIFLGVSLRF